MSFARLSYHGLIITSIGGLVAIGAMSTLVNRQRETIANELAVVKKAIKIMQVQPTAMKLLGEPIEIGRATFRDGWTKMKRLEAQVKVPIKGQNDTAELFVYARKKVEQDKWRLFRIELAFGKVEGKKLLLLDLDHENLDPLANLPAPAATTNSTQTKAAVDKVEGKSDGSAGKK